MKKFLCLTLTLALMLSLGVAAMASGEATEEASAEEAAAEEEAVTVPDPIEPLEPGMQYFEGVTIGGESTGGAFYIYAPENPHTYDMLSSFMNGLIFVYTDKPVQSMEEAQALVEELGLDTIAEGFPAYVAIPVPMNGESWTAEDYDLYWEIQVWMAGGAITLETNPPQGEYVRHTMNTLQYIMAEGSGATFVNNVISQDATRVAGIALFGGEIDADIAKGVAVPAYLVNASEDVTNYWKTVNGTDTDDGSTSYNSSYVQKKVITAEGSDTFDKDNIQTAWSTLLSRTTRLGVAVNAVIDDEDKSEWVLMDWVQPADIGLNLHSFEWDAETGTAEYYDEYVTKSENSVHVYVPEAVEEDPDEAVPLVVVFHGMSDDPLNVVMGCGWAQKAAEENFIILSPATEDADYVVGLIEYVQSLYNIDTTRMYVTGFSMGGMNTSELGKNYPDMFAAIAPMGSAGGSTVEGFDNDAYDLPVCMIVGSIDTNNIQEDEDGNPVIIGISADSNGIEQAFEINGIDPGKTDYAANPFWGYTPDEYRTVIDKDLEWQFSDFYSEDYDIPVVELVTLIGAAHSNADYMATVAWDFMSNFSRGADGSLIVNE